MQLDDYQSIWKRKPVLRRVYSDFYSKINSKLVDGKTLEIGGGIGNLLINSGTLIKSDIQITHGMDVAADAHHLPFQNKVFSNIVLFDVLHHLQCPIVFFREAERVLKPGGMIVMIEPGITPISWLCYKLGHDEPIDMGWGMSESYKRDHKKDPYDSNQAIPTILFKHSPKLFQAKVKELDLKDVKWLSLFVYPLSGGFKNWSLVPLGWIDFLLKVERKLLPYLGWLMAFRLLIILEKKQ